jgi:hypothetical protein
MATTPPPQQPLIPPMPPRSSSNLVVIALLILALIIVLAGLGVWIGLRIISHNVHVEVQESAEGKKDLSIKTPLGSLEVHKQVNEASLGLPIYPGATRVPEKDSATVNLNIAGEQQLRVLAAKFETNDAIDKVQDFYRERLGSQVTKYVAKNDEGKTVLEIKSEHQEKVVALKREGNRTQIELVRVWHGRETGN